MPPGFVLGLLDLNALVTPLAIVFGLFRRIGFFRNNGSKVAILPSIELVGDAKDSNCFLLRLCDFKMVCVNLLADWSKVGAEITVVDFLPDSWNPFDPADDVTSLNDFNGRRLWSNRSEEGSGVRGILGGA